jgi:archaellum component FlaC
MGRQNAELDDDELDDDDDDATEVAVDLDALDAELEQVEDGLRALYRSVRRIRRNI